VVLNFDVGETIAPPDRFLTKISIVRNDLLVYPSSLVNVYVVDVDGSGDGVVGRRLDGVAHVAGGCTSIVCCLEGERLKVFSTDQTGVVHVGVFGVSGKDVDPEPISVNVLNDNVNMEWGWSGVALTQDGKIVFGNFFGKRFSISDGDRTIGSIRTLGHPSNIVMIDNNTMAITEDCFISLWDIRSNNLINRIIDSNKRRLYGLSSNSHFIVAGGDNRNLTYYDIRSQATTYHWKNCTKFETSSVHLTDQICYVTDLYSITPGKREDSVSSHRDLFSKSIKADSRLIGTTMDKESNTFYSITERGTLSITTPIFQ